MKPTTVGLRRLSAVAATVALAIAGAPTAATATASAPALAETAVCALKASGHAPDDSERRSCLSVTAKLSRAPAVNQTATLEFTVTAAIAAANVDVSVELPANLRWSTPPVGMSENAKASKAPVHRGLVRRASVARAMTAGQQVRYSGVIEAIGTGPAEISVRAAAQGADPRRAGADAVFLTVGATGSDSRLGIRTDTSTKAVAGSGPTAGPLVAPDRAKPAGLGRRLAKPATQLSAAAAAASPNGTVCASGAFRYIDHTGTARPTLGWIAQVFDVDANGDDLLAQDFVGWSGEYNFCVNNGDEDGTGQDVYVRFLADAGDWRVTDADNVTYNFWTDTRTNLADGASVAFGTLQPGDAMYMRAAEAFDAAFSAWQTIPGNCWDMVNACRPVVIRWEPGSTDGTYYRPSSNDVHLAAADPDAPFTVVHEITHSIMDDVYQDNMPAAPNCSPHFVRSASSAGCAWVEGFAEWFPAVVFNDPTYRWPDGSSLNLENPTWDSAGWDDGDTVEGRVAGALIDLWDTRNEGDDGVGEGMGDIWSTFQAHNSTTFARFWADRGADGFDVGNAALGSLFQSSVDYGFVQ